MSPSKSVGAGTLTPLPSAPLKQQVAPSDRDMRAARRAARAAQEEAIREANNRRLSGYHDTVAMRVTQQLQEMQAQGDQTPPSPEVMSKVMSEVSSKVPFPEMIPMLGKEEKEPEDAEALGPVSQQQQQPVAVTAAVPVVAPPQQQQSAVVVASQAPLSNDPRDARSGGGSSTLSSIGGGSGAPSASLVEGSGQMVPQGEPMQWFRMPDGQLALRAVRALRDTLTAAGHQGPQAAATPSLNSVPPAQSNLQVVPLGAPISTGVAGASEFFTAPQSLQFGHNLNPVFEPGSAAEDPSLQYSYFVMEWVRNRPS